VKKQAKYPSMAGGIETETTASLVRRSEQAEEKRGKRPQCYSHFIVKKSFFGHQSLNLCEMPEKRHKKNAGYRRTAVGKPTEQDRKIGIFVSESAR
jgi:hypothetical protein